MIGLRDGKSGVPIPAAARVFIFSQNLQTRSKVHPDSDLYRRTFPGLKRPELKVNYLSPSSTRVNSEYSYTCAPPGQQQLYPHSLDTHMLITVNTNTRTSGQKIITAI